MMLFGVSFGALFRVVLSASILRLPDHAGVRIGGYIPPVLWRTFAHDHLDPLVYRAAASGDAFGEVTTVLIEDSDPNIEVMLSKCGATYAFQMLIPGAYRADLIRYCVLWLYGGWYLDIAGRIAKPFTQRFAGAALVVTHDPDSTGWWNGFIGAEPRHPALQRAIRRITMNVRTCYYGDRDLAPTGPMLWHAVAAPYNPVVLNSHLHVDEDDTIDIDNHTIRNKFVGYKDAYRRMGYNKDGSDSYSQLWLNRRVYRNCDHPNAIPDEDNNSRQP